MAELKPTRGCARLLALGAVPLIALSGWGYLLDGKPAQVSAPDCRWPIIYVGDCLRLSEPWRYAETFEPLFGADRDRVNPAEVVASEGSYRVSFPVAGEYYLRINGRTPVKACVLTPEEPLGRQVARVADFCSANLLWCDAQDRFFLHDQDAFIDEWFYTDQPGRILCAPTVDLFLALIHERFGLPTRLLALPTVYRDSRGEITHNAHNIAEVYIPELGDFALFDLNSAFRLERSGPAFATLVNDRYGVRPVSEREFAALDLRLALEAPKTRRARVESGLPWWTAHVFDLAQVGERRTREEWPNLATLVSGGVAYYANRSETAFLNGTPVVFGSLHRERRLEVALSEKMASGGYGSPIIIPLHELRKELRRGFQERIRAAGWERRARHLEGSPSAGAKAGR